MAATSTPARAAAPVTGLRVRTATIPTDAPESDGTFAWSSTTIVVVEAEAGGCAGLGWTYGPEACASVVHGTLRELVLGRDALDVPGTRLAMDRAVRNMGRVGVAAMALSAVDVALWDLKARLLGVALCTLIGRVHEVAPVYGSGGFCSYSDARLADQLAGWVQAGIPRVKMKVAREPGRDPHRVAVARRAIGDHAELYVDANGAYRRADARGWARRFRHEWGVSYLEEPVSSDDRVGLALLRDTSPPGLAIAAGEYGYDLADLRDLVPCVDVLQADVTRCGGITQMLAAGALAEAHQLPFSAHCAPNLAAHPCCAIPTLAHIEYFHDHVRIEQELFDGTLSPEGGALQPDPSRPGHGMSLRPGALERHGG